MCIDVDDEGVTEVVVDDEGVMEVDGEIEGMTDIVYDGKCDTDVVGVGLNSAFRQSKIWSSSFLDVSLSG